MRNPNSVSVVSYTKAPITAEPADKYYDILTDIRYNLNELTAAIGEQRSKRKAIKQAEMEARESLRESYPRAHNVNTNTAAINNTI